MEKRTLKVLETVVNEYIRSGEPVGSKLVQEKLDMKVSSATIRNESGFIFINLFFYTPHYRENVILHLRLRFLIGPVLIYPD